MKIHYITNTLLAVLFCSSVSAHMATSADILSWIGGNFNFQYELSLCDQLAVNSTFSFGIPNSVLKNDTYKGATYFMPQIGLKYYLIGKATEKGFYVNPLLGLGIITPQAKDGSTSQTATYFNYSFYTGYAWNVYKGLWLDAFAGIGRKATSLNEAASIIQGVTLNAGMMVGYAW